MKVLFCFPENPHIIKLTVNLIIVMVPFFKKSYAKFSYFPNRSHCWMTLAILITNMHCFPFYAILFTPDTFTVKMWNISTPFFDTETLFQTNKIDGNINEKYGSIYWKGRFFNICFLWHHAARSYAHTGRPAENTKNGWCVRVVWDNLKNPFITYQLTK